MFLKTIHPGFEWSISHAKSLGHVMAAKGVSGTAAAAAVEDAVTEPDSKVKPLESSHISQVDNYQMTQLHEEFDMKIFSQMLSPSLCSC